MAKKLNIPNKLTVLRICLTPIFVILMVLIDLASWIKYVALAVYLIASITDYLDGYIARKNKIVTTFGKLMDPLADKILVASGFIMLTGLGIVPAWITVIVVGRDFLLNTIRMFGTQGGETISAGIYGKIKTACQMVGVSLGIIDSFPMYAFLTAGKAMGFVPMLINVTMSVCITVAVIFTIWSCIDYIIKYRKYIKIDE
ncbi:MAG: CDP-diacylglycerol--glycerol-3-phosphate 3-phosphatidyltransferase [Clostridia bacterium]|nr:CDP-diacylglycerol--glycerol-3-phosphate 3-phosphatidyltransferase [Clostridia bacterium]